MRQQSIAIYSGGELIGDAIQKLPFLRAARSLFPDHRVCWLTSADTAFETRLHPLVMGLLDEVAVRPDLARSHWDILKPSPIKESFDILIDTQSVVWRTIALRRIPHRLFVSPAARFLLSDRRPAWPFRKPGNLVQRLLLLLELAARRPVPSETIRLSVPEDLAARAASLLPAGPRYLGLAPGAGSRIKCWPLECFIALAKWHSAQGGTPVFILGPDELEWLPRLRAEVPGALFPEQETAVWGTGFSPIRTVALAGRLSAAVTNDSGVGHLLAAADIPLLTLFGPTNAEKFRPVVSRGEILRAQAFGSADMASIPTEAVIRQTAKLMTELP